MLEKLDDRGLSVLIVNYNGEKYIRETIYSIKQCLEINRDLKYEILIADNKSNDSSIEILKNELSKVDNVFVSFLDYNYGFGKANNILVQKAQFKYLLLINNDTKSLDLSDSIELIFQDKLEFNTISTCRILNADMSIQQNIYTFPKFIKLLPELFLLKPLIWRLFRQSKVLEDHLPCDLSNNYFSGCFLLLHKNFYLQNGGFDLRFTFYHEEADLFYRIRHNSIKIVTNDKIIHYGGGGKDMTEYAFVNYYSGLYKLFYYNKITNPFLLKTSYIISFSLRIFLLAIGLKINFTPFVAYSKRKNTKTKSDIIRIHREVLKHISEI